MLVILGALAAALVPPDTAVGVVIGGGAIVAAFILVAALAPARPARLPIAALERHASERHEEMLAAVRHEGRVVFAQVEALLWLRDLLGLERPLNPTRDWAASPDFLLELVRTIDRQRPGLVVELGGGVSTVVIARRLTQLGSGALVSIDHDDAFAQMTRDELGAHGLGGVARVIHAPLGEVALGDRSLTWYVVPPGAIEAPIDLLVVDGPPQRSGHLARYPALPILRDRMAAGASILLDDANRPSEQEAIRRWQAEIAGLDARRLDLEAGACLLRMPG